MKQSEIIFENAKIFQIMDDYGLGFTGIDQYMKSKGYRFLAHGAMQVTYKLPNADHVIKIFMGETGCSHTRPKMDPRQRLIKYYYDFCKNNQDIPFLPKMFEYQTFVWPINYTDYCLNLQIRMEALLELNNEEIVFYSRLISYTGVYDFDMFIDEMSEDFPRLVNQYRRLKRFYNTVIVLNNLSKKYGFRFDLHPQNIMKRSNGTPVIVDPWA